MSQLRARCISTKVTDDEYRRLQVLAGEQTLSEWVRSVLLKAATPSLERVALTEVLALRTILLNLHFGLAAGQPPTAEAMHRLIEHADQDKIQRADECLIRR
jgi:hypothetical protein